MRFQQHILYISFIKIRFLFGNSSLLKAVLITIIRMNMINKEFCSIPHCKCDTVCFQSVINKAKKDACILKVTRKTQSEDLYSDFESDTNEEERYLHF